MEVTHGSMQFCPICGNLLAVWIVHGGTIGQSMWRCDICNYKCAINRCFKTQLDISAYEKRASEVISRADRMEGAQITDRNQECEQMFNGEVCGCTKAEFWEQQIRSADEPTTTFYKCTKCGFQWME